MHLFFILSAKYIGIVVAHDVQTLNLAELNFYTAHLYFCNKYILREDHE